MRAKTILMGAWGTMLLGGVMIFAGGSSGWTRIGMALLFIGLVAALVGWVTQRRERAQARAEAAVRRAELVAAAMRHQATRPKDRRRVIPSHRRAGGADVRRPLPARETQQRTGGLPRPLNWWWTTFKKRGATGRARFGCASLLLVLLLCGAPLVVLAPEATPTPPREEAQVVDVVDGDTIKVRIAGEIYTVRYIGMDAPETVHPTRPVEWMGPEASAANAALVAGRSVRLEKDVSETDRYGRLLRYVYVGDTFVNAELVRQGYAQVSTYPPDVKYEALFLAAQQEARQAGRGLWRPTPTLAPE